MKAHIFFSKYANTPLEYRHYPIITHKWRGRDGKERAVYTNLHGVYIKLHEDPDHAIHPEVEKFLLEHTL